MRSSLFWDVTKFFFNIWLPMFLENVPVYRSHFQGHAVLDLFKMGPVSCPETSVAITNQRCVTSQNSQDLKLKRFLIYYQQSTILQSVAILLLRIFEKKAIL